MIGVLVNVATVLIGSAIGLLCRRGIPERITDAVMTGIGLCTVYIGVSGALTGDNALVAIISMALGAIIGTLLDIDGAINRLGDSVERRFAKSGEGKIAQGFVTASLLFCVGAMTVVGSLNAGLTGDNELLFTKSTLDFVSSMMLAASLGFGVMLAAAFVFFFQGGIVLLSGFIAPFLNEVAIADMTCVGSLLIIAIGLNIIGITKIKVSDYSPAIFLAPVVSGLFAVVGGILG